MPVAPLTKQSISWSIAIFDEERLGTEGLWSVRRRDRESDLAMLARSMPISLALGSFAF